MKNRNLFGVLAITALLMIFIGGYFVLDKFDILSKRQVVHTQPADDAQQTTIDNQENQEEEKTESSEEVAEKQENKIEEEKIAEKTTDAKTVEPEKQTEAKVETGKIVDKLISWGFTKSSDRKIDTIIVHSSYDALGNDPYSVSGIIAEYKQYEVSAHYLIARDGVIYRLVAEQNIAWHAGVSEVPDGRTNTNAFSIGIEMMNTKDGKYTSDQYDALNSLISSIKGRYKIKYILGHNEVAPGRKTDPWNIDWKKVNR